MTDVKEWPDPDDYCAGKLTLLAEYRQERDYCRALADAWESRARVAVEALSCLYPALCLDLRYAPADEDRAPLLSRVKTIEDALKEIGELPKEGT
jgi:hypothetical protein